MFSSRIINEFEKYSSSIKEQGKWNVNNTTAYVILHASHCIRHTACVTLHASHCIRHTACHTAYVTACVTLHASHCMRHTAYVILHMSLHASYCMRHTAYVTLHTSYCICHTACVTLCSDLLGNHVYFRHYFIKLIKLTKAEKSLQNAWLGDVTSVNFNSKKVLEDKIFG